jgi:hypothetical protein
MKIYLLVLIMFGCGSSNVALDDGGNPLVDAALDDGGNPIIDAAPGPANLVEMPLDCVAYTYEVHNAATDGSRERTINAYATVNLPAGTDFVLSRCDAQTLPTCQGGDVCTGELEPPATKICGVSRGSALFYDGKLTILCSQRTERVSGSGVLTVTSQSTFTMKLEIFQ